MYKAPTGPVGTLQQALRRDLQNMPIPEPSVETAARMAQVLREIGEVMRAVDEHGSFRSYAAARRAPEPVTYWRRCS